MKNKTENIYDNVVYDYKKMDDAPYKLNAAPLRSMQKMERALNFILNNLEVAELPSSEAAKQAGYEESYYLKAFRPYFGMPLQRFFAKLKLRKAAREIQEQNYPKQIGAKLGGEDAIEYGASTLKKLNGIIDTSKMNKPSFMAVLTGVGKYAYRREDNVYVIPVGCLRD